jgi:hypothetical protein
MLLGAAGSLGRLAGANDSSAAAAAELMDLAMSFGVRLELEQRSKKSRGASSLSKLL